LAELWTLTRVPGYNVQYILCRWADAAKNTVSTLKTWRKPAWNEDGDSLQDSTSAYSEMPGELKEVAKYSKGIHTEEQYEKLRRQL